MNPAEKSKFLNDLLDKQTSEGLWQDQTFLPRAKTLFSITSFNEDKLKQQLTSILDKKLIDNVVLTIIALWLLQEKYETQEDEWQMIAKKARGHLKSLGIAKVDPYFKTIDEV